MQVANLRWSPDLDRTEVHGIVHLIFGLDFPLLAVIIDFPELGLRGFLVLWLEQVLEVLGDFIDFLVWTFSSRAKVVCG